MKHRPATPVWILLALAAAVSGCAYTVSSSSLPPHLKTVAIPVFENGTVEYTLEQDITNAVVDRFVRDNHLKVVEEKRANSVIRGRITGYRNSVFGFSEQNRAQEYRVTISVAVSFKDLVKNREVWNEPNMVKVANYFIQPVPGDSARTEVDGRRQAIRKLADEIFARTVEGW